MNQTPNLSTLISEMVTGVITGVSTARKYYFRTLLVVAVGAFMIGTTLRDYIPGKSAPVAHGATLTPEPARNQQFEPRPSKRSDVEELRKLIRPNPM